MILDCETEPFAPGDMLPRIVATVHDGGITLGPVEIGSQSIVGFSVDYDMGCHARDQVEAVFSAYDDDRVLDLRVRVLLRDYANLGKRRAMPYSLDAVAQSLGAHPHACKDSEWRTRFAELANVQPSDWPAEARTYIDEDYRLTRYVAESTKAVEDETRQSRYAMGLRMVAAAGLLVDEKATDELAARIDDGINALRRPLAQAGLLRLGLYAEDDKREMGAIRALAERDGIEHRTPTGAVAVGAKALKHAKDPALRMMAEYQAAIAVRDREIKLLRAAPIVHTHYDLAVSGRSTSSAPNLQNLSKRWGIRECFRPRPGNVFLIVDYPALELRTLAQAICDIVGPNPLASAFRDGIDPHLMLARERLGASRDDPKPPERQLAKAANFGFPGGLQGESFAAFAWDVYGIKVEDPEALRRAWMNQWRGVQEYMAIMRRRARNGTVEHLRSGRKRGCCSPTQASNTMFQGLGADVAKDTLWHLVRDTMVGEMRSAMVVAFVHDEFVFEVPRSEAARVSARIDEIMQDVWTRWCPDVPLGALEIEEKERWSK